MTLSVTGRRSRAKACWWERELTISEILAEPIVKAVMKADGVEPDELAAILADARERLLKGTAPARVSPPITP
jgi:hypothetical protein